MRSLSALLSSGAFAAFAAIGVFGCTGGSNGTGAGSEKAEDQWFPRDLGPTVQLSVPSSGVASHLMGWAMPDEIYLSTIPLEARTIRSPSFVDPGKIIRFTAYESAPEIGQGSASRRIWFDSVGDYDQWYLDDLQFPKADRVDRFVAVISIHRATKKAYFFEIKEKKKYFSQNPRYKDGNKSLTVHAAGDANCYECHVSGLRKIVPRPHDSAVDRQLLEELNKRIEDTGIVDFNGAIDSSKLGQPLDECSDCHDGKDRGKLYPLHKEVIGFKLKTLRSMPPEEPLPEAEADRLLATLDTLAAAAVAPDVAPQE